MQSQQNKYYTISGQIEKDDYFEFVLKLDRNTVHFFYFLNNDNFAFKYKGEI